MGAKRPCRSPNGGGCPLLYALYIANGALFHPTAPSPFPAPSGQIFRQSGQIFGKKGQKLDFICSLWCFLGKIGDRKRQKQRYILLSGLSWCCFYPLLWWRWWCPLVAGGQGFEASGPAIGWLWSSGRVFPAFCPLCCFCLWWVAFKYALFRVLKGFLARFGVFVWVCLAWVLCVACGAFVCVSG